MTMPMTLETAERVPWRRRLAARIAVAVARPVAALPPARLGRVLTLASRRARPASAARTDEARRAVVAVSVRCAGQVCLQRAVATALLCRFGGTWPDWCTGVRLEPFKAHAWVEAEGRPIGENAEVGAFAKVLVVSAGRR
ncbi:lasso peptide biosynthesis B2 protein [Actinomadura harenae]|uniref:Lasso peptide biosynthesis B2 protein n=1 Tax=Actinomadura harenae TaxID=2483351 RepID=A0A3M2M272_9ACTN|nr:lasso peptide biosynthesis B2 protein [Actinomadura harenae]RMI43656.1 lasso peptide biosynthesis B2 protein [Actinomadura harenae]